MGRRAELVRLMNLLKICRHFIILSPRLLLHTEIKGIPSTGIDETSDKLRHSDSAVLGLGGGTCQHFSISKFVAFQCRVATSTLRTQPNITLRMAAVVGGDDERRRF